VRLFYDQHVSERTGGQIASYLLLLPREVLTLLCNFL
jgi:hypothetical protein